MDKRTLQQVRTFNRYFATKINVFNRYALGTSYSLVEGRIIGEIGRNEGCTAIHISLDLKMDKSYLSRILRKLDGDGLIYKVVSEEDSRKKHLSLTDKGRKLFDELECLSDRQAEKMLAGLSTQQIDELLKSMAFIQGALEGNLPVH